jgi:hypothetical protein
MTQYAEMIAHSCKSVHVPGVAWPGPIEVEQFEPLWKRYIKSRRTQNTTKTAVNRRSPMMIWRWMVNIGGNVTLKQIAKGTGGQTRNTNPLVLKLRAAGCIDFQAIKDGVFTYSANPDKPPKMVYKDRIFAAIGNDCAVPLELINRLMDEEMYYTRARLTSLVDEGRIIYEYDGYSIPDSIKSMVLAQQITH